MKEVKEKLKQFLLYIENNNGINVNEVHNKFEEIFKDSYIKKVETINEAYFQSKDEYYYLKNGNGVVYKVMSGDWDRYGSKISHTGIDIAIYSEFSKDENCRDGFRLFSESENLNVKLSENLENLFDIEISKDKLIKNDDRWVYKVLSSEVKDDEEIVKARYEQLKFNAELQHEDEVQYDLISPYGGLDAEIHSVEELIYDGINYYYDDEFFKNRALALFHKDYPEYLKNQVEYYEHAKYILDHIDEYKEMMELEGELMLHYSRVPDIDIDKVYETRKCVEKELMTLKAEYEELSNKKYGILDLIVGTKRKDQQRMLELYNPENSNGLINDCEEKLVDNKLEEVEYKDHIQYSDKLEEKKKKLKNKLEKPFVNFTLDEDLCDIFNKGKYIYVESLEQLEQQGGRFINELNELRESLKIAEEYTEEIVEKVVEAEDDMEM